MTPKIGPKRAQNRPFRAFGQKAPTLAGADENHDFFHFSRAPEYVVFGPILTRLDRKKPSFRGKPPPGRFSNCDFRKKVGVKPPPGFATRVGPDRPKSALFRPFGGVPLGTSPNPDFWPLQGLLRPATGPPNPVPRCQKVAISGTQKRPFLALSDHGRRQCGV